MFIEVVVCAFIGIIAMLAILTLWRKKYSRFTPDNKHSIFQVLLDAIDSIFSLYLEIRRPCISVNVVKYFTEKSKIFRQQPLFTHWLYGVRWVIIHKAEAVKELLKEKRIIEKSDFYDFLKPYFGTSILTCDTSQWKERRKLLAPCFQSSMLKGYLNVFNEHAQKLVEFLHEETGKEFTCVERPISLCSLDIACESILGVKIGALQSEAEKYVYSLHRLLDLIISRMWKFWQWTDFIFHYLKAYRELLQHLRVAHGFSRSIIKERKLRYMNGETIDVSRRPKCLLDVLLKLHIEDQVLDEEGVRQEVDTFISAGHDTSAAAVKWTLYLIGLYPEVQEKIHQELDSVLGADSKGPLSVANLNELTYLECVLKVRSNSSSVSNGWAFLEDLEYVLKVFLEETNMCGECNRLYPPVPVIARKVSEETTICGYTIPNRTTVIVSPFLVHRDEDVFPDPEKFDPERFLPENSVHIPECAYIPFVAGPRNCIDIILHQRNECIHLSLNLKIYIFVRTCLWRDGSESPGVSHSEKLLSSLSGLEGPSASVAKLSLQSSQPARIKFRRREQ
ncbi:cytochrome P450 4V2 [Caerostris extrusa]|uniref:Cytochrome P450 4V2 n=1 Tax=Caerostris extrusa TaxID=172846 RepID=A0AAV4QK30_CAEEX|nr:cytochrome P450 4V2 [Caerostris extrusa]